MNQKTMQPTKTLPSGYLLHRTLDLTKDKNRLLILNGVGLVLLLVFGWFFWQLALALRPDADRPILEINLISILALIVVYVGVIVLHEIFHGLFFWIFTREQPQFGFKGAYAYAAAPDWYLPRLLYLVVGLAPLVGISILGIILLPFSSPGIEMLLVFALTMNAAGAVGDLWVVAVLSAQPAQALICDQGDAINVYLPAFS